MIIMDCTLRDGANVVGNGFSRELTQMILSGLCGSGVQIIELGNAKGLGAYEIAGSVAPLTDREYLELARPYLGKAKLGMFLNAARFRQENVEMAGESGIDFLRVGIAAGDGKKAKEAVACTKNNGMQAYFALMKAYILSPQALAEEGRMLAGFGADELTIMDSAGTMEPEDVARYVEALKKAVDIPVGFHGHNNLGLAVANAGAAAGAGADILDCGLLGMARSAGNIPTEAAIALLERRGTPCGADLGALLHFLDRELIPAMEREGYRPAIRPLDLILGCSGAHSSLTGKFRAAAERTGTDLYRLIMAVSRIDRKAPSEELMEQCAQQLGAEQSPLFPQ